MSIHRKGKKWRVHWRVAGRQRTRTFDRKGDAITFDAEMTTRRQLGPALAAELDRSALTLGDYVRGPWRARAATLAAPTRAKYAWASEKHLGELPTSRWSRWTSPCSPDTNASCSAEAPRRAPCATSSRACAASCRSQSSRATSTPTPPRALRKVPAKAPDEVRPFAPIELERLITRFDGRDRAIRYSSAT